MRKRGAAIAAVALALAAAAGVLARSTARSGRVASPAREIDVTSAGKTIATWGEGFSYTGPGGTWFNVQR
jgi:hypothetical protein